MKQILGYERPDNTFGIRNHVCVLPTVSCVNGVVESICREVPETVPLFHGIGCGRGGMDDLTTHSRTLMNLCKNPNISSILLVGLGCEVIKMEMILSDLKKAGRRTEGIMVQDIGGSIKAKEEGVKIVKKFIEEANQEKMVPSSMERLVIGLECGGSDAFSGVTANPGVGSAADWLVDHGATVILTETTEMIGTTHILQKRAKNQQVADRIEEIISKTKTRTEDVMGPLAKFVIAPGNMDGGMSSIKEKALGCITKAGTREISQVIEYGEIPAEKGVIIMNGPGYDAESITGLIAGGAQQVLFTTGRGTPLGHPVSPVVKIASTGELYHKMIDDMDINGGIVLEGSPIEELGMYIRDKILEISNGEHSKAEINNQNGILCVYTQTCAF